MSRLWDVNILMEFNFPPCRSFFFLNVIFSLQLLVVQLNSRIEIEKTRFYLKIFISSSGGAVTFYVLCGEARTRAGPEL